MSINAQDLIRMTQDELGGYSNAVDNQELLRFLNQGKDEMWSVIHAEAEDYFVHDSQFLTPGNIDYFGPLSTTIREYTLPLDCHEPRFIEVVSPLNYEDVRFIYRPISHPEFQRARRGATNLSAFPQTGVYYYTILGPRQFKLAQYPEVAFQLVLSYVRQLPDLEMDDTLDEILFPYSKKLIDFAVRKVLLLEQDQAMFDEWSKFWREEIITLLQSAGPRQSTDPVFAIDFEG